MSTASGEPAPRPATPKRWYGLAGVGLVVGAVVGWLGGLLRAPRQPGQQGPER